MRPVPKSLARGWAAWLFLFLAALLPAAAQAAAPGLRLTARVQGIDSEATRSEALRIESLDVKVRLHGSIAETIVTARFANPGRQILEGDFTLAMPAGSVVTGYALDVNGAMLDGVLVDQRQARLAYEARVRAGIDPGLAEVGRDNLFRTRVFPILPGSGRTIRLRFTTPTDLRNGYVLPLDAGQVGAFSLGVEASGMSAPPRVALSGEDGPRWTSAGARHTIAWQRRDARIGGSLTIAPALPEAPILLSRHPGEGRFFQIEDGMARRGIVEARVRNVALLWDRSLSRADDDLAAEIGLVRRYLERVRPETIELILFDSSGVERVRVAGAAEAVARLEQIRYRGASSLAVLAGQDLGRAGACLLFTDGLVTIDRRDDFRPACPLFAVSSARDADRIWLGALARRSGGESFDLGGGGGVDAALTRLTRVVPRVLGVRSTSGAPVDYALLDGGEYGWRIVGPMPDGGGLIVRLAGLEEGVTERLYSPSSAPPAEMAGAGALWARDRVGVLEASDDSDRAELVRFARRYSVASPGLSFLVLETAGDYARSNIEPPPGFAKDQRLAYEAMRRDIEQNERRAKDARLQLMVGRWDEQQAWWRRRFDPNARPVREKAAANAGQPMPVSSAVSPPPPPPPPPPMIAPPPVAEEEGNIVVTGSRVESSSADSVNQMAEGRAQAPAGQGQAAATIILEPWAPDRPYLAALDAAAPAQAERVFAEQQAKHGAIPAFWLDVAEHAFRKGRRDDALALVLSALDLPTRNNQTLSIVADRLMRYGDMDRAVWLYERLVAAEPDRPQPRRSLALALAKRAETGSPERRRADLARAISLLAEVVMTPWAEGYDGIEMISLMEANRLVPLYRAVGGSEVPLDRRLVALLDVDLRVVIEWNSEATDIDLWVDEPNGERAIYSNPRTAIGGRLSNDMTQGYGPEEYLLHRAPNGAFTVRAHVYAADRINPNGASQVSARLIRDFGRPTQREEVIDIELLPDQAARERLIGRIEFRR